MPRLRNQAWVTASIQALMSAFTLSNQSCLNLKFFSSVLNFYVWILRVQFQTEGVQSRSAAVCSFMSMCDYVK